jgi:hypothetical protein
MSIDDTRDTDDLLITQLSLNTPSSFPVRSCAHARGTTSARCVCSRTPSSSSRMYPSRTLKSLAKRVQCQRWLRGFVSILVCHRLSPQLPHSFFFFFLFAFFFAACSVVDLPNLLTSLHSEISRLICTKCLHCSIDKVHGVETTRPGMKTAQYGAVVRRVTPC